MKEPYSGFNKDKLTIDDVKRINREHNQHFFDRDTMKFFKSHIETSALMFGQLIDGKYFITSEQYDESSPRFFSVQEFDRETGRIHTEGNFQEFNSKEVARKFAWCLADNHGDAEICRRKMTLERSK